MSLPESLNHQAAIHTNQGNCPQALNLLKDAINVLKGTTNYTDSISMTLENIVHVYEELKDWEKALESLSEFESFLKHGNDRKALNWCSQRRVFLEKQIHSKRPEPKRNDPCHCGSGKKYKNCCGK